MFLLAASLRTLASPAPLHGWRDILEIFVPYGLIAFAPLAGYAVGAAGASPFKRPPRVPSLLPLGQWRHLGWRKARRNPLFGPAGFLASLLIGLLLNVVLRSLEFLAAVPALNNHAPGWGQRMFLLFAADVAVMSFFYTLCFALALKTLPLFPKMLVVAWVLDILIQLLIAQHLGSLPGLPSEVEEPLGTLLRGNIYKVLISAAVWAPYLLLSDRVNVTYRHRIARRRRGGA